MGGVEESKLRNSMKLHPPMPNLRVNTDLVQEAARPVTSIVRLPRSHHARRLLQHY